MKPNITDLPLHGDKAPAWPFKRLARLGGAVTMAIMDILVILAILVKEELKPKKRSPLQLTKKQGLRETEHIGPMTRRLRGYALGFESCSGSGA